MYILEKEVRVLRKMSKKASVDDPVKSVTSISAVDVSERESSVEGTSDGHVFSDNDQENTPAQSEVCTVQPTRPLHACTPRCTALVYVRMHVCVCVCACVRACGMHQ